MKLHICIVFFFVETFSALSNAHKYADVNNLEKDKPFRMSKVNTVWEKARRVLKDKQLTDLYADLVVQDRRFMDLKWKKQHQQDKDGLIEARSRKELLEIINKYNLGEFFPGEKLRPDGRDAKVAKPELRDDKLKAIWKKASFGGFSEAEMDTLKEELSHHQMKLDEFNSLKTDYEILKDNVDNSLDNLDEQEDQWRTMEKTKKQMKDKHRQIQENYDTLKKKVDGMIPEEGEFKDPRVYQLWALAKKSKMSEEELNSIQKELTHFERRIQKAEVIKSELNKSEQKIRSNDRHQDLRQHRELIDKTKQYNAKVDKYHEDLRYRIQRRLDEL